MQSAAEQDIGGQGSSSGQLQACVMRRAASAPTLRSSADPGNELEVYVVMRNFKEQLGGLLHRLPPRVRDGIRDCGVCHYMTVFRKPDGTLVQFDFGPKAGGDIHVGLGPLAGILGRAPRENRRRRRVDGAVRELKLTSLPDAHLYVGRTPLSLADIRAWNSIHEAAEYELHRFDCRHYVNSVVRYATGCERATSSALHHQWEKNRGRYGLANGVVWLGQYITDVGNWDRVRGFGHAAAAALMTLTGRKVLARVSAVPLLRAVQRRVLPAARTGLAPVSRAIVRRPAYAVGTAAVATLAASSGQAPTAVRETISIGARMAGGAQVVVRAAGSLAQHVGRSASAATQRTTRNAATVVAGIAGAATRGAANLMAARPRTNGAGAGAGGAPVGSPQRASLLAAKPSRAAQQLALVATRR